MHRTMMGAVALCVPGQAVRTSIYPRCRQPELGKHSTFVDSYFWGLDWQQPYHDDIAAGASVIGCPRVARDWGYLTVCFKPF